jgi:hypothetical protein
LDSPEGDSGTLMTTSVAGDTPQQLVLELDCVHVVGNTALVSGTVIRGTEGYVEVGRRVWYLLADRGTAADQPADGITGSFGVAEPNCELVEGPFFSFVNVQAGDITISTAE